MKVDTRSKQQIHFREATSAKFSSTCIGSFGPYMDPHLHPYHKDQTSYKVSYTQSACTEYLFSLDKYCCAVAIITACESKIHPCSFIGHDVGGNPLIVVSRPGIVHDNTLSAFDQPFGNYHKISVGRKDKKWENCEESCLEFHFEKDGVSLCDC